jgi:DNA segregation ATPase FtsK/SpoIIIE, S-DNA-T family
MRMPDLDEIPVNRIRNRKKESEELEIEEASAEKEVIEPKEKKERKPRNEPKDKQAEKTAGPKPSFRDRFQPLVNFVRDERVHRVTGLFLILSSAYMLVAFTSFLFTWQADQDKVMGPWGALFADGTVVENWLGKLGAVISHVFIHKWFGVASFVFALIAFVAGVRALLKISVLPIGKTLAHGFFHLVFISITLGFIFSTHWFFLGGTFGYQVSGWLGRSLGGLGTGLMLFFAALTYLVVSNANLNLLLLEKEKNPENSGRSRSWW